MSVQTVPAKELITCDRCGAQDVRSSGPFLQGVHARQERWSTAANGALTISTPTFDLCGSCLSALDGFLKPPAPAPAPAPAPLPAPVV